MIIWLTFGIALIIISINDFLFFRIENEYVVFLLCLYFLSYVFDISGQNFFEAIKIAVAMLIITGILNQYNLIGGGDVKLLFPLLLLAENNLLSFIIGSSVGGIVLSLAYIFFSKQIFFFRRKIVCFLHISYKKRNKPILLNIALLSFFRINKRTVALRRYVKNVMKQEIPYGLALSCGGFYVIVENLVVR